MAEYAKAKNLAVGVGLQRHHQKGYLETLKRIKAGQIGEITSGRVFWNQGSLWMKPRKPDWTDVEWQIRNWLYFTWLSGDHIVEQHIHNIDVSTWFIGKPPVSATAMGGREVRKDPAYGNIFDHFAVDYEYPDDVHVMSMCRQIPGCANDVSEHLRGTKGRVDMGGKTGFAITAGKGSKPTWTYENKGDTDPYVQEHTDLIESIRKGKPYNELKAATESNLAAIMGRMSAYTGKKVTWEQALNSKEDLVPKDLKMGKLEAPKVPVPGSVDII
jgi:predicted dehydrogenase